MTNPEDDVLWVALVGVHLFGTRYCKDRDSSLREAREWLKRSRSLIDEENDPRKAAREELYAQGDPQATVVEAGSGVGLFMDRQFPERIFIRELLKGLTREKRWDRQKTFATKWWLRLMEVWPEAPDIADSQTWTLSTLTGWKEAFDDVYKKGRSAVNAANLRPSRRKRSGSTVKKRTKVV